MREILGLTVVWAALGAGMVSAAETRELHFKSPGPGMYFTAGLTVQVWADIIPRDDDHPGWPQAECRWDDLMVESRVSGNNKAYDYFPFTVPAAMVTPGIHTLKLNGFGRLGATNPPQRSMPVQVDPWPADKALVDLSEDRKYTDLNWTDVAVRGNGHTVTVSGKLTIKNSLVTGLGSMKIVQPVPRRPKDRRHGPRHDRRLERERGHPGLRIRGHGGLAPGDQRRRRRGDQEQRLLREQRRHPGGAQCATRQFPGRCRALAENSATT